MKKKIDTRTQEEIEIDRFSNHNHLKFIPSPNRFFDIGEKVIIGNLKDCKMVKQLFDGKAYLIEYTSVDNNYGNPISTPGILGVFEWMNIFKITKRTESFIEDKDLFMQYSQTGMSDLLLKMYHFGVNMNPVYQRDYVWSKENKVALIDSIYKNVDIGKFVFVKLPFETNSPSYEILDGKQRLNTIKEFYEDKLLYNGLKYSELSRKDRYHFREYTINICQIQDCSLKQKLRIFYKLNISGKVMDTEHLVKIKKMRDNLEEKE